jgi:hypothetical protein
VSVQYSDNIVFPALMNERNVDQVKILGEFCVGKSDRMFDKVCILIINFMPCSRLFSDGGNFCAAETAEYGKRLEKATQKIDAVEQQLYAELKTVEPKMLEESTKIVHSFEDR